MNGFSDLDMINYRYLVYSNVIQAVSQLIEGAEHLQIPYDREIEVSKVIIKFLKKGICVFWSLTTTPGATITPVFLFDIFTTSNYHLN